MYCIIDISLHSCFSCDLFNIFQVAAENLLRKISISVAVEKVSHAMRVLWPRSRLKIFGSNATGLALPCSDVDLVVCLPPVRNLVGTVCIMVLMCICDLRELFVVCCFFPFFLNLY